MLEMTHLTTFLPRDGRGQGRSVVQIEHQTCGKHKIGRGEGEQEHRHKKPKSHPAAATGGGEGENTKHNTYENEHRAYVECHSSSLCAQLCCFVFPSPSRCCGTVWRAGLQES